MVLPIFRNPNTLIFTRKKCRWKKAHIVPSFIHLLGNRVHHPCFFIMVADHYTTPLGFIFPFLYKIHCMNQSHGRYIHQKHKYTYNEIFLLIALNDLASWAFYTELLVESTYTYYVIRFSFSDHTCVERKRIQYVYNHIDPDYCSILFSANFETCQ